MANVAFKNFRIKKANRQEEKKILRNLIFSQKLIKLGLIELIFKTTNLKSPEMHSNKQIKIKSANQSSQHTAHTQKYKHSPATHQSITFKANCESYLFGQIIKSANLLF